MTYRTIQFRLTAWYFVSVAIVVTLFAAGSWLAMRAHVYRVIDSDLSHQMNRVVPFVRDHALNSRAAFHSALMDASDSSIIGIFLQITDNQQNLLYESDTLMRHRVPAMAPSPGTAVTIATINETDWPLRVASSQVVVAGTTLNVHIAQPLAEVLGALRAYVISLAVLIPVALVLITSVGYWMSQRALHPVDQIRKDADAIDPANLTARLPIPPADDELSRLARTLNAMLTRIEKGFLAVRQFTADASHELRAPLSLITTAADVSSRRERTSEEMAEALRKILREARHMSNLVENLLALARGDASHVELVDTVDVSAILRELGEELKPLTDAKDISFRQIIPEQEILVRGVYIDLRRLFLILLDNAVKYTEAGSITLTLSHTDQIVEVELKDTGIGIDPSGLPHVFDRFWRADKVRARAEGGLGLGLSLAHQIVQRHGGTISVTSEPDRGSTFSLRFRSA